MNYYPNNLYQNYAYSNPTINTQPQVSGLQGKVVDGADMVKATEVMFGGYGVFPKADLSEIYIKNWNNNGTTQIITYRPVEEKAVETKDILLEKIQKIEEKLDLLTTPTKSTETKRKDVDLNAY